MQPSIGINIRNTKEARFADLIINGDKVLESRETDSLRPYVGKRVGIIRTGEGKAKLIGTALIGEPIVADEYTFRKLEQFHLVKENSKFDIKPGKTKHLYPMMQIEKFDTEVQVTSLGIISRKI